ncbi:SPOR domain-containing protein [Sulfurimonas sp.]|jgi:DedD protein|uniref:SPOR domain-containing protein n=1 Tax=Sulfurimonas sp. TaxID=2022749 RepID=UPI0025EC28C5|nr:SPOR domain-containing protein [Sulfurimonas sp.]MBT5933832.1 SPOR domain-containing protein [Sulfurimonas sp.]
MNNNNELNDIILNKGGMTNSNKKIILSVATLGVILIIVVMLMNSLSSSGTDNLPQAVLPPQPEVQEINSISQEPLFKEIEVIQEDSSESDLDLITKKLKEESIREKEFTESVVTKVKNKEVTKTPIVKSVKETIKKKIAPIEKVTASIHYYIQVGSFSKYKPNKRFLDSIEKLGFPYEFRKMTKNTKTLNKVLVGPFSTEKKAKDARRILRSKVEPGAFLVTL